VSRVLSISPAWWEFVRASARRATAFRLDMFFSIISMAVQIFVLRTVWSAVYDGRSEVDGISADTLLVYITISTVGSWFLPHNTGWFIQERIRSGDIALDLVRPFHVLKQVSCQAVGQGLGYASSLLVVLPMAALVGSLDPPSPPYLMAYLVSYALAFLVSVEIGLITGMFAFWMQESNGVRIAIMIVGNVFSGAMVPLWLMPDALRFVVQLLPFQAMDFLPASIYSGQATGWDAVTPLVIQVFWIGILSGVVRWMWKLAQRKIVIHGG
jgi:ABC-2 type transport system permease protein